MQTTSLLLNTEGWKNNIFFNNFHNLQYILLATCLILFIMLCKGYYIHRQGFSTISIPKGFSFTKEKAEGVYINFLKAKDWKFNDGGFIVLSDKSVILPTSNISKVTQGYTWYTNEKRSIISTNDKDLVNAVLEFREQCQEDNCSEEGEGIDSELN